MRSPLRTLAATTLVLEAMVVFFAALVAKNLSGLSVGAAVGGGSVLALLCLLDAGLLRLRLGYGIGWVLQFAMIATGVYVPMMFGIGAIFTVLWGFSLFVGTKVERERSYVASALAARTASAAPAPAASAASAPAAPAPAADPAGEPPA